MAILNAWDQSRRTHRREFHGCAGWGPAAPASQLAKLPFLIFGRINEGLTC